MEKGDLFMPKYFLYISFPRALLFCSQIIPEGSKILHFIFPPPRDCPPEPIDTSSSCYTIVLSQWTTAVKAMTTSVGKKQGEDGREQGARGKTREQC